MTSQQETYTTSKGPLDDRVAATCKVWRSILPLMIVSLFFVVIFKMVLLPVVIVLGATLTAMAIWMFAGDRVEGSSKRERALAAQVAELETRLENIETISRMEMNFTERDDSKETS